jgi:NADPH:quinone reductase-like Zn-dependent oxidoreductase
LSAEVLVQVHAISINPVDVKTRKGGALLAKLKAEPPVILGWDISGVVVEAGGNVSKFKKGDAVFGMVNFPGAGKAYAEYVATPEAHLAAKPDNISHAEAAATTLAALTAWQVLVHEGKLASGQQVLVHAAAGGVGHFAVQIARHLGATVIGTASAANAAFLKELGVSNVIDYTNEPFEQQVQQVDFVLDPIGGDTTARSLQVLKKGGMLISIVGGVKERLQTIIEEKGLHARNYLVHASGADMEQLAQLLQQGILKPFVSQEYALEQIQEAHRHLETGRTKGKLVVRLV